MAKRPRGVSRKVWLAERAEIWRRRNMILNGLMLLAIVLVLFRYCYCT